MDPMRESIDRIRLRLVRGGLARKVPTCADCSDTGWRLVDDVRVHCPCHGPEIHRRWGLAGIPRPEFVRGWDTYPPTSTPKEKAAIDGMVSRLRSAFEAGESIVLAGGNGRGKTVMLCGALKRAIESGRTARYVNAADFAIRLSATFGAENVTVDDLASDLAGQGAPEVVGLDDLGAEAASDDPRKGEWARWVLSTILQRRHDHGRQSLVVTNYAPSAIEEAIGARLWSRLQTFTWIAMPASMPSFRRKP